MSSAAKYQCAYCEHQFRLPQKWLDHESICKLLADPTQYQPQDDDPIVTMIENSTTTTYKILKHLARRQQQLEKDLIEIKKQAAVKIDTLEWLQQSVTPAPTNTIKQFIDIVTAVNSTDDIDDLLSTPTPIDWIAEHFTTAVTTYKKQITAYTQRPIFIVVTNPSAANPSSKMFYYCNPTDSDPIPLWKETTQIHEAIWDRMCKNTIKAMGEWRSANKAHSTPADEKIYQGILLKVIDTKKEPAYHKKIKGILIDQLKYPTITYHLV